MESPDEKERGASGLFYKKRPPLGREIQLMGAKEIENAVLVLSEDKPGVEEEDKRHATGSDDSRHLAYISRRLTTGDDRALRQT
jgi:hypothetical protein